MEECFSLHSFVPSSMGVIVGHIIKDLKVTDTPCRPGIAVRVGEDQPLQASAPREG